MLPINHPEYAEIKGRVPRLAYDPARAAQAIADLGYAKAADGRFVDSAGQPLEIEIRTTGDNDANVKTLHSVVDYWQRTGVTVNPVLIPPQQQSDREYRATFPGFGLYRHPNDVSFLQRFTSAQVSTRQNNWTGGDSGYHSPEYDALFERYSKTIPVRDRIDVLGQLIFHLSDQAVTMGLYYDNLAALIGNRVTNVVVPQQYGAQYVWSAHLWDRRN
jgi:hypothetical protein